MRLTRLIVSAGDRATFDPKENRNTERWPLDGQVSSGERVAEGLYIARGSYCSANLVLRSSGHATASLDL